MIGHHNFYDMIFFKKVDGDLSVRIGRIDGINAVDRLTPLVSDHGEQFTDQRLAGLKEKFLIALFDLCLVIAQAPVDNRREIEGKQQREKQHRQHDPETDPDIFDRFWRMCSLFFRMLWLTRSRLLTAVMYQSYCATYSV